VLDAITACARDSYRHGEDLNAGEGSAFDGKVRWREWIAVMERNRKGSDVPAVVSRSAMKRPLRCGWDTTSTEWEQSISQRVGVG